MRTRPPCSPSVRRRQDLDKLAEVLPPDTICAMTHDRLDQIALRKWCFTIDLRPTPRRSAEHELLTRRQTDSNRWKNSR
jgi:hypothetical protein